MSVISELNGISQIIKEIPNAPYGNDINAENMKVWRSKLCKLRNDLRYSDIRTVRGSNARRTVIQVIEAVLYGGQ